MAGLPERIVFLFTGGLTMEGLFAAVNAVLSFVTPVSDFFWDFPKMFGFWKAIPLLGQFSLAIIVLVGSSALYRFSVSAGAYVRLWTITVSVRGFPHWLLFV